MCLHIFPLVSFIVFCHFLLTVVSSCFILIYNRSDFFQRYLLQRWFDDSKSLWYDYITFFWGNPGADLVRRLTGYVTGVVTGSGFERARNNEKESVRREVPKSMAEKKELGVTWKDAKEFDENKKAVRDQVIEDDTTILKLEAKLEKVAETVKEIISKNVS
jgi:hypothetical protein